jgi:hypothetical protein
MSDVRGRLKRLEREGAIAATRSRMNPFDAVLELMLGQITLEDVNPDDRLFVERLYRAMVPVEPASASPHSSQETDVDT